MKNTKRFHLAWLMLLLAMPGFAETSEAGEPEEKAVQKQDMQKQEVQKIVSSQVQQSAENPSKLSHEAFLQKELIELYRQDEVVITYFFMDQFFPLLIEQCDKSYRQQFDSYYPKWKAIHQDKIDSGNSIIRGRFKEDPEHVKQAMEFALMHLQSQSEEFQQSLCKEVVRTVTPEANSQ